MLFLCVNDVIVYVEKPRDSRGENFLHMHNNLV